MAVSFDAQEPFRVHERYFNQRFGTERLLGPKRIPYLSHMFAFVRSLHEEDSC